MNYKKQWNLLNNALKSERLAHALLFFGQKGLGKKFFALSFAKHIIGDCKENIHPDLIFLNSADQIKISQIKDIAKKLSFKPYSSDRKIAIVNNAHLMNKEAQNCFLKFLEEPTPKTHLILITQYPNLLLPTILSRTQKVRFYPSNTLEVKEDKEIISHIIKIYKSNLVKRFEIAKNLTENDLDQMLDEWLSYFRKILLLKLKNQNTTEFSNYSLKKTKEIIEKIQTTKFLISSTNINSRLALENLFLFV